MPSSAKMTPTGFCGCQECSQHAGLMLELVEAAREAAISIEPHNHLIAVNLRRILARIDGTEAP